MVLDGPRGDVASGLGLDDRGLDVGAANPLEAGVRLSHPLHLDAQRLGSTRPLHDGELAREVVCGVQEGPRLLVADPLEDPAGDLREGVVLCRQQGERRLAAVPAYHLERAVLHPAHERDVGEAVLSDGVREGADRVPVHAVGPVVRMVGDGRHVQLGDRVLLPRPGVLVEHAREAEPPRYVVYSSHSPISFPSAA